MKHIETDPNAVEEAAQNVRKKASVVDSILLVEIYFDNSNYSIK